MVAKLQKIKAMSINDVKRNCGKILGTFMVKIPEMFDASMLHLPLGYQENKHTKKRSSQFDSQKKYEYTTVHKNTSLCLREK